MRTRPLIAVGFVAAAAAGMIGCLIDPQSSTDRSAQGSLIAPLVGAAAKPDSVPPPRPPKPPKPVFSVQFAGADSASAGQTATTFWLFTNTAHSSITADWTLTDDQGWAGLPQQDTLTVEALGTRMFRVAVAVPATAAPGSYPLHMTATSQKGTATADGAVQVSGPDSTRAR
jgi:hypothetical protein